VQLRALAWPLPILLEQQPQIVSLSKMWEIPQGKRATHVTKVYYHERGTNEHALPLGPSMRVPTTIVTHRCYCAISLMSVEKSLNIF